MKKTISTICIILTLIFLTTSTFAKTGTIEIESNCNEVKPGDTFSIKIKANSEDGINGVVAKFSYDKDTIEIVSEKVEDSSTWSNLGISPEIAIICGSTENIKNANIYNIQFKVKDNAKIGNNTKIEVKDILLDTDLSEDSEINIPDKKIEIKISEKTNKTTLKAIDSLSSNASATDEKKTESNGFNVWIIIGVIAIILVIFVILNNKKASKRSK